MCLKVTFFFVLGIFGIYGNVCLFYGNLCLYKFAVMSNLLVGVGSFHISFKKLSSIFCRSTSFNK